MKSQGKDISVRLYATIAIVSVPLIILFINWLQWPLLASLGLGIALILHTLILCKYSIDLYTKAEEKGLTDKLSERLKYIFNPFYTDKKSSEA